MCIIIYLKFNTIFFKSSIYFFNNFQKIIYTIIYNNLFLLIKIITFRFKFFKKLKFFKFFKFLNFSYWQLKTNKLNSHFINLFILLSNFNIYCWKTRLYINWKLNLLTIFKKNSLKLFLLKNSIQSFNSNNWNIFNFMNYRNNKLKSQVVWLTYISSFSLIKSRLKLNYILAKSFFYQKKLTNYLLKLYNFKYIDLLYWFEFSIVSILLKSTFFFSKSIIFENIQKGFIFINFKKIFNSNFIITFWDFIVIKLNLWHLINYKKSINLFFEKKKIFNYFYKYKIKSSYLYPKTASFRINNKVLNYLHFFTKLLFFLEIDFFSFSIIVLKLFKFFLFSLFSSIQTLFISLSIRSYNWKYIS